MRISYNVVVISAIIVGEGEGVNGFTLQVMVALSYVGSARIHVHRSCAYLSRLCLKPHSFRHKRNEQNESNRLLHKAIHILRHITLAISKVG